MEIKVMQVGMIQTNCYLLEDETAGLAAIVDPGDEARRILTRLEQDGMKAVCVLLTHAHFDHTGAIRDLRRALPGLPVYLHPADAAMLGRGEYPDIGETTPYGDGDTVAVGNLTVRVIETPGHTPGGVTLLVEDQGILFTGDTLFEGSIGRTDFAGGDLPTLMASLNRLAGLEGDYRVLPGHMGPSTLNRERRTNYYMMEAAGH